MSKFIPPAWVSPLARTGYAGKGIVYIVIGVFSLLLAFGKGGDIVGSSGALGKIAGLPFGSALLVVTGIGLLCYSAYRLLCAFVDAEREGGDKKGIGKRLGYLGSGLAYAALAIKALTSLGGSGGDKKEEMAAKAMTFPGANWIIGILGLAIMVAGICQWVKLYKGSYHSKFTLDSFAAGKRQWVERLAKMGLGARGVIFQMIGASH